MYELSVYFTYSSIPRDAYLRCQFADTAAAIVHRGRYLHIRVYDFSALLCRILPTAFGIWGSVSTVCMPYIVLPLGRNDSILSFCYFRVP